MPTRGTVQRFVSSTSQGTGPFTTGAFTPPANSHLTAIVFAKTFSGTAPVAANITLASSPSLTWTRRAYLDSGGTNGMSAVAFTAEVGASPASTTLTLDAGTDDLEWFEVIVVPHTGYDTASPVGVTFTDYNATAGTASYSRTLGAAPAATSDVIAGVNCIHQASGNVVAAAGTGWTQLSNNSIQGARSTQTQARSGSTSTTLLWDDITNGATNASVLTIAIEIKDSGAPPPTLSDADTDEILGATQTGAAYTGTNLTGVTLALVQGATEITQGGVSGTATGGTFNVTGWGLGGLGRYGVTTSLKATTADGSVTLPLAAVAGQNSPITPPAGRAWVTLGTLDPTAAWRVEGDPIDLQTGWQIEYDTQSGVLTIGADGVPSGTAPIASTVARLQDGTGWSADVTLTFSGTGRAPPPPTISPPPTAPVRSDPATFPQRSNAWVAWLEAEAEDIGTCATVAAETAVETQQDATAALAASSPVSAALWVSGTTYAIHDVRRSPLTGRPYRRRTAGAGTTDPSADRTNWADAAIYGPDVIVVTGTSATARTDAQYVLTNASATTLTLPAAPAPDDIVWVTAANGRSDNVVARNGKPIMGLAEDMTIGRRDRTCRLRFVDDTRGWRLY